MSRSHYGRDKMTGRSRETWLKDLTSALQLVAPLVLSDGRSPVSPCVVVKGWGLEAKPSQGAGRGRNGSGGLNGEQNASDRGETDK